mgnify:CR=1 FL=1
MWVKKSFLRMSNVLGFAFVQTQGKPLEKTEIGDSKTFAVTNSGVPSTNLLRVCSAFVYPIRAYMRVAGDVARVTRVRNGRHVVNVYSARQTLSSRARHQASDLYVYLHKPTYHQLGRGSLSSIAGNLQAERTCAIQCVAQLQAC